MESLVQTESDSTRKVFFSNLKEIIDFINKYDVKYILDEEKQYDWEQNVFNYTIYHMIITFDNNVRLSIQTDPKWAVSYAETAIISNNDIIYRDLGYADIRRFSSFDKIKDHLEYIFKYFNINLKN